MLSIDNILKQLKDIIQSYDGILERQFSTQDEQTKLFVEAHTRIIATLYRFSPPGSAYSEKVGEIAEYAGDFQYKIQPLIGVLCALQADYEAGYLDSIHELIHADTFSDLLEMAESAFDNPNIPNPAAAILASGVLEEHLRNLFQKHIGLKEHPPKLPKINEELEAKGIYGRNQKMRISPWIKLRNDALHAKHDDYTDSDLKAMLTGMRDFIENYPA